MPVWFEDFEGGSNGAAITTSNTGLTSATGAAFTNVAAHSGSLAAAQPLPDESGAVDYTGAPVDGPCESSGWFNLTRTTPTGAFTVHGSFFFHQAQYDLGGGLIIPFGMVQFSYNRDNEVVNCQVLQSDFSYANIVALPYTPSGWFQAVVSADGAAFTAELRNTGGVLWSLSDVAPNSGPSLGVAARMYHGDNGLQIFVDDLRFEWGAEPDPSPVRRLTRVYPIHH